MEKGSFQEWWGKHVLFYREEHSLQSNLAEISLKPTIVVLKRNKQPACSLFAKQQARHPKQMVRKQRARGGWFGWIRKKGKWKREVFQHASTSIPKLSGRLDDLIKCTKSSTVKRQSSGRNGKHFCESLLNQVRWNLVWAKTKTFWFLKVIDHSCGQVEHFRLRDWHEQCRGRWLCLVLRNENTNFASVVAPWQIYSGQKHRKRSLPS